MRLNLNLPKDLIMVAIIDYLGGEEEPTVELAVFDSSIEPGQADSRLTDEGQFQQLTVRKFFPGSGCGVVLKEGKIVFTEAGLQGFSQRSARVIHNRDVELILLVWKNQPRHLEELETKRIAKCLRGLQMALC